MMKRIILGVKIISLLITSILFIQCDQKSQSKSNDQKDVVNQPKEELKKGKIQAPKKDIVVTVSDEIQRQIDAKRAFQKDLEKFILSTCLESNRLSKDQITLKLLSEHEESYTKTHKEDGLSFCIHEIYNNTKAISRIIYSRTEGGHYSDIISLWSLNKKTNELRQLHLFSIFGKDGYHQEVTTEFDGNTFIVTEIENSATKKNLKTVKKWKLFEDGDIGF